MLTQERLKELLHYDEETGIFTRAKAVCGKREYVGKVAGTLGKRGYHIINIDYKLYPAHRLAWLYMTGHFPEKGLAIDHINEIKTDNSFKNLRVVTNQENTHNISKPRSSNKSTGVRGVTLNKRTNKYVVEIWANYKRYHLGTFDNLENAKNAYLDAKKIYHPSSIKQSK